MATSTKKWRLTGKASSHAAGRQVQRGETITDAQYKKLDAKRKAYYTVVATPKAADADTPPEN
ncbi:MAG: hypothetical protein RhofKO_25850 [Rhodothermales bacterium]